MSLITSPQQAAQLGERAVGGEAEQLAFQHVRDLVAELLALPAEAASPARPVATQATVEELDDPTDFELDPARVERPIFRHDG